MKKKKKLNKLKVKRCVIVVVVLLIILICYKLGKDNNQYKNLTILYNNEFIETINDVIIDKDSNIYFSKDDIQKLFDENIYYNEAEEELITTYNKHVALLKIDEEYALINDENINLKGKLKEENDKIYLPLTDLANVYDLDIQYSNKSNRIIMDSTKYKKVEATLVKRTKLKKSKGVFSRKIENLIIGDKVTVLDTVGNYKKVRTELGNIGYIKTKKLSDEKNIREDVKEEKKEIEVYKNYSNIAGIYENIEVDTKKLNVVSPTFFIIDKNSKVLDKTTSSTATYSVYKNWVDNNKLELLPRLDNNELVSESLLSYSQRSQIINSLIDLLKKYNYIGINIDFDKIDDVNSFNRFIIELAPRFKNEGLKVCVTINNNLDKKKIEKIVDYVVEE